jgi:hypothetical protein
VLLENSRAPSENSMAFLDEIFEHFQKPELEVASLSHIFAFGWFWAVCVAMMDVVKDKNNVGHYAICAKNRTD